MARLVPAVVAFLLAGQRCAATATAAPTAAPTTSPTATPTSSPTASPTVASTVEPTAAPTITPSSAPTAAPSSAPTAAPTASPTPVPTLLPTEAPTAAPTAPPTSAPTAAPSSAPTAAPTAHLTTAPTTAPTESPTVSPTAVPWPLTYDGMECCDGFDCGQSTLLGDVSFAVCQQGCTQQAGCIGIEYGNDRSDAFDRCSDSNVCTCYLVTGSCQDQLANFGYSYYANPSATTSTTTTTATATTATNTTRTNTHTTTTRTNTTTLTTTTTSASATTTRTTTTTSSTTTATNTTRTNTTTVTPTHSTTGTTTTTSASTPSTSTTSSASMNSTEGAEENVRNVSDANSVIAEDSCVNDGGGTFGLPGLLFTVLLLVTLASLVLACRADERWARRYPADSRPVFACDGAACDRQPSLMAYLCSQLASLADPAWIPQELTYCALAREEHLALGTVRAVAEASWRCALHSCGTGRAASAGAVSMAPAHGVAGWDAVNQQVGAPETPLLPSERALSVCDAFWRSSLCRRLWVVFLALNPLLRWRRYSMFVSSRTRLLVVAGEVFGSLVVIVLYLGSECESGVPLLEDILLGALGAVFSVLLLVPVQLVLLRRGLACRQPRGQDTQEVRSEFSCPRPPKTATDAVLIAYLLFCALYLGLSVASAGPTTGTRAAVSGASSALGMVGLVPFCKAVLLSVGAALQQRREPGSLDAIRKLLRTLSVSSRREERIGDAILNRGSVTAEPEEPRKEELRDMLDAVAAVAKNIWSALQTFAGADLGVKATAAQVSSQCAPGQIEGFMAVVERQWEQKGRTLAQELCENLRQPRGSAPTTSPAASQGRAAGLSLDAELAAARADLPEGVAFLSLRRLAEVCRCVQRKYTRRHLHEDLQGRLLSTCCWVVYTMQDVDIDRLFGFPDCPVLPPGMEEPALRNAVYNEYRARCNGGRCPQMFSASNWAARVCFDRCGDVSSNIDRDALSGLQTWVKWLCFLGASARDLEVPVTVTRGLCGLPEQLVDDFRRKQAGDSIFWAAPSSTTDDARISDSYCNQQEPRERNVLFTVSGVTQAFPMFELSQYPKEREWLLPPFSQLRVDRVVDGAPVRVECTFVGCSLPGSLREGVVRDFKQASQDLGRVLAAMEGELSALRQQLERAKRRCTVSAKAVFRVHLRFLARASASGALPLQDLLDDFRSWQPPPPRGAPPRPSAEPPAGPCADAARAEESAEGAAQAALAGVLGGARRCEGVPEPPAVVPGSALDEAVQRAVARIRGGSGAREQALRKPVRKFERDGCTFCEVVLGEGPARSERLGFSFASGSAELARGLDGRVVADPTSQGVLVVRRVASGGLLNRWNLAHPVADVVAGDRIVEVNGVHGVRGMVRELRAPVVRMLVARYPERFHVELTQVCSSNGVAGDAIPGSAFCAAHGAAGEDNADAYVHASTPTAAASNLTQGVASLGLGDSDMVDAELAALDAIEIDDTARIVPPPGLAPQPAREALLKEWVENGLLQHFDLVQPASLMNSDTQGLPVTMPASYADLLVLLNKLGYNFEQNDHWTSLGFARLEGPDPTAVDIIARGRAALTLVSLAASPGWLPADVQKANALRGQVTAAVHRCETELTAVLSERRRVKASKLPVYRELGLEALRAIQGCVNFPNVSIYTQLSDVLRARNPMVKDKTVARAAAALAEKGNDTLLDQLIGQTTVMWTPSDHNALTHSLVMVSTVPVTSGLTTVTNITDLCSFPLLSETWLPIVKDVVFISFPFEMVLPTVSGFPRVGRQGLALFFLQQGGHRSIPRMLDTTPLFQVDEVKAFTFDILADSLHQFLALTALPLLAGVQFRCHRRSPLSTAEMPRVAIDMVFPGFFTDFDLTTCVQTLRRVHLPTSTYFGSKGLAADADSFILECNGEGVFHHYWPLCSQMSVLSKTRFLVISEASAETWTSVMDNVYQQDPGNAASRLKHRPSRFGGRVIASPAALAPRVAAAKRRAAKGSSLADYTAEAIQVGQDMVGIQVANDFIDLAVESGNDPRARA
ncbi:unnamed protein product [Prorocentrum cordatum]|uniref:PDZ domain-containing protein n=1 Tax=Prorocentrum cordatum TaxID=2364126 RepID=A0ABN9PZN9_9DINO|nr:unnamed protein product [Polarella glacialis]